MSSKLDDRPIQGKPSNYQFAQEFVQTYHFDEVAQMAANRYIPIEMAKHATAAVDSNLDKDEMTTNHLHTNFDDLFFLLESRQRFKSGQK